MILTRCRFWFAPVLLIALAVLAGCRTPRGLTPDDLPTAASIEMAATAQVLTQNAPPPPFNRPQTGFSAIDANLNELPGWRYTVRFEFEGAFSGTPRTTSASAGADVSFNQAAAARRVTFSTTGDLIGAGEEGETAYEAVRLGPDAFLVRGGACLAGARSDAATAADLRAGDLIGGVRLAEPAGRQAIINGAPVYLYSFSSADVVLPSVQGGSVRLESGEVWIAPTSRVVVRYYANLVVENATLFERQLPVTGAVRLRYDLFDIGTAFNITTPFGC